MKRKISDVGLASSDLGWYDGRAWPLGAFVRQW